MLKVLAGISALSLIGFTALPASAHERDQVQYELRQQGYHTFQFLVAEPPHFQVNACREGERFHLHVDYYGRVTERSPIGPCRRQWGSGREHTDGDYRYRRY